MSSNKNWQQRLNFTQRQLIKQSFFLLDRAKKENRGLFDYAFIVMPAAKAFEGFLKQLFFDLNLISEHELKESYFRVGKALNPELEHIKRFRKECLFDELSRKCNKDTALFLWRTWKQCRNRLFHYFSQEKQVFNLAEAEERLKQIVKAIKSASTFCALPSSLPS